MYYLILKNGTIGFDIGDHGNHGDGVKEGYIPISEGDYQAFFEIQNTKRGVFIIKPTPDTGGGLWDYITFAEDLRTPPVTLNETDSLKLALAEMAEKQQADCLEGKLALAELIESLQA